MGADRALLVQDEEEQDSGIVAHLLAAPAERGSPLRIRFRTSLSGATLSCCWMPAAEPKPPGHVRFRAHLRSPLKLEPEPATPVQGCGFLPFPFALLPGKSREVFALRCSFTAIGVTKSRRTRMTLV